MPYRPIAAIALLCLIGVPAHAAPKSLVDAVIHVESGGNPNARGKAGEIGLMQIMLRTARSVGYRGTRQGLFHPATNVRYGSAYLDLALKRARGNLCHAASLYQSGLAGRLRCSSYGKRVLKAMRRQ